MTVTNVLPAQTTAVRRLAYQLPDSTPAQGSMANFAENVASAAKVSTTATQEIGVVDNSFPL